MRKTDVDIILRFLRGLYAVKDRRFEADVDIETRGGNPVESLLRRKEIIYVPGIHHYTMTEMTKGVELSLEEFPEGFEAFFAMRPYKDDIRLEVNPDKEQMYENVLLLPRQGIELLFKLKPDSARPALHGQEKGGTHLEAR